VTTSFADVYNPLPVSWNSGIVNGESSNLHSRNNNNANNEHRPQLSQMMKAYPTIIPCYGNLCDSLVGVPLRINN